VDWSADGSPESLKKKSQGMTSFHRNMLDKMESKHDQLVAAAETKGIAKEILEELGDEDDTIDAEKAAAEKARKLKESGAAVETNEEGLVVDKTQLLAGGLNVTASKKRTTSERPIADPRSSQRAYQGRGGVKQDMRARQTKMLEEQLEQATKRALEEEERSKAELERQSKSRKTESDVQSAKERYLARKAAAAAAAKKE
jgi:coiled-coil domain-containing protein 55